MGFKNADLARELYYCWKPISSFLSGIGENSGRQYALAGPTTTVVFGQLTTSTIIGMIAHAAGDLITDIGYLFQELDYNYPIYMQVLFSSASADVDSPVFKFHYAPLVNAAVIPAVTGTTISFDAKASEGQYKLSVTAAKTITASTFTKGTQYIYGLEADNLGGASADEVYILGLIYYGYKNVTGQSAI